MESNHLWKDIVGFLPVSMSDWEGRLTPILFMRGCNFRCPTCHNNQFLELDGKRLAEVNQQEIKQHLEEDSSFYDGIVISGGEPTVHRYLPTLVQELIQIYGKDIKVDTNGSNPDMIHAMFNTVSQFYIDIKGPWDKYDSLAGLQDSAVRMRDNFAKIFSLASKHPNKFVFRTTRVSELTNSDLEQVKAYLPNGLELRVQKFVQRKD